MADKRVHKDGIYKAEVLSSKVGPSGSKGTKCAEIECQLIEHTDRAGVKTNVTGNSVVTVHLWLSEKNLTNKILLDQIATLKLEGNPLLPLAANEVVGRELALYCKAGSPNAKGDVYDDFSISTGTGGGSRSFIKAPASAEDLKKLGAMMGFKSVAAAPLATVAADDF